MEEGEWVASDRRRKGKICWWRRVGVRGRRKFILCFHFVLGWIGGVGRRGSDDRRFGGVEK